MTADSFIDSSIFNVKKDDSSIGGFKKSSQGNLAEGLGREKISAVLPLYLFKEHWEIGRRKSGPLLGLMCTLDVMGYSLT